MVTVAPPGARPAIAVHVSVLPVETGRPVAEIEPRRRACAEECQPATLRTCVEAMDDFGSLDAYAWFIPGVVISALLAVPLGHWLGSRIGARRVVATLFVFSVGTILAATVTPSREALIGMPSISSGCDLSRIGPAAWREYVRLDDASLNVLLFVPLGLAIGLLPRSRPRAGIAAGAILLPFGVEAFQLLVAPLGRACQAADVSDNLMGLALGVGLGLAAARIKRRS